MEIEIEVDKVEDMNVYIIMMVERMMKNEDKRRSGVKKSRGDNSKNTWFLSGEINNIMINSRHADFIR